MSVHAKQMHINMRLHLSHINIHAWIHIPTQSQFSDHLCDGWWIVGSHVHEGFWHLSSTDIIETHSIWEGLEQKRRYFSLLWRMSTWVFKKGRGLDVGMLPAGGTAWESVWGAEHWSPCISEESGSNEASGVVVPSWGHALSRSPGCTQPRLTTDSVLLV